VEESRHGAFLGFSAMAQWPKQSNREKADGEERASLEALAENGYLVVGDRLLIEVKCVDQFTTEHLAQCINYLKASGLKLALLINFRRPKVEWRRIVHNL
jgi:PD-(D/E)XK nuclease superfamily